MSPVQLDSNAILRVVAALVYAAATSRVPDRFSRREVDGWTEATSLGPSGLALDSIERMAAAAAVTRFFRVDKSGIEDYFLARHTLGEWAALVKQARGDYDKTIVFHTSGTTGDPKDVEVSVAALRQEVDYLAGAVDAWLDCAGAGKGRGGARGGAGSDGVHAGGTQTSGAATSVPSILSAVMPHHIYGFLFSIMLPAALGTKAEWAAAWRPSVLAADDRSPSAGSPAAQAQAVEPTDRGAAPAPAAATGTLVVGFPEYWAYVDASLAAIGPGVVGVSSTAPLDRELRDRLVEKGLSAMVEIYGSTETGGIGARITIHRAGTAASKNPYELFPYWRFVEGGLERRSGDGSAQLYTPMDYLDVCDDRRFVPTGRRDRMIQVAGHNLSVQAVEKKIQALPGVADVAVVAFETAGGTRLKAFVVPASHATMPSAPAVGAPSDPADTELDLRDTIRRSLPAHERPVSIVFSDSIAKNEKTSSLKPSD